MIISSITNYFKKVWARTDKFLLTMLIIMTSGVALHILLNS